MNKEKSSVAILHGECGIIQSKIPAKLLLIGDGPDRSEIEEFARACQTCGEIKFLGKQEQMEDILPIADLFLLPSEYESFGLAALEAMAAGSPVITSNAGGLPEIIEQGTCGFMANVADVESMAQFGIEILKNDASLANFKKEAKKKAAMFDIHNIVPQYEKLYERILKN